MRTVSVVAQKGGTGKTTLCLAVACAAVRDGLAAVVVDLDPQATAASWGDRRDAELPVVVPAQPPRLARVLDAAAAQGVDLAVVDTAPRIEQGAIAAARAADLVLVPCRPAVYDLETVAATVDTIRAVAPDTSFLCVLNGVPPRGPRQPQARRLLADMGVPVCVASLGLRAAVDYAAAAGASAQEYEPRGKAAAEVAAVYDAARQAAGLSPGPAGDFHASGKAGLSTPRHDDRSISREGRLSTSPEGYSSTGRLPGLSATGKAELPASRRGGKSTRRKAGKSTGRPADVPARRRTRFDAGQVR
ncbi:MAG: ParA family protein [Gammaproteobacteria bacterium]|nr:ParA family protein [Gammaproteobacteria bacterium]